MEIVTAVIACLGTVLGSFAGVMASHRLTIYRIDQLEKKVEKHNQIIDRVTALEQSLKSAHYRIDEVKKIERK